MKGLPNEEQVQLLREQYQPGTRVELISMEDLYSNLKAGDRGTVVNVDDIGTIHCNWDCGSYLGLAYGEDRYRKLTEQEVIEEQKDEQEMKM